MLPTGQSGAYCCLSVSVACQCLFPCIFRVWCDLLSGVCFTGPGHGIITTCSPTRRQSGARRGAIVRPKEPPLDDTPVKSGFADTASQVFGRLSHSAPEGTVSLGDPSSESLAGLAPPQQRGCSTGLACGWHARLLATVTWSPRLGHPCIQC